MSLKSGRFSSSSSSLSAWGDLKVFFEPTVRKYKSSKIDTSLTVKDIGQARRQEEQRERGDQKMDWTILSKGVNTFSKVTWADMVDEAIGCTDPIDNDSDNANDIEEVFYPIKEKVFMGENSCRNFCCLSVLASSLLIPIFSASLYVFIQCYFGNPGIAALTIEDGTTVLEVEMNMSEFGRNFENNVGGLDIDVGSTLKYENTSEQNIKNDSISVNTRIYFPAGMMKEEREDVKVLKENLDIDDKCLLQFTLVFTTIFIILLTFTFIVGYTCSY